MQRPRASIFLAAVAAVIGVMPAVLPAQTKPAPAPAAATQPAPAQPAPAQVPPPKPVVIRHRVINMQPMGNPERVPIESVFTLSIEDKNLVITPGPAAGTAGPQQFIRKQFIFDGLSGQPAQMIMMNQPNQKIFNLGYNSGDDQQKICGFSVNSNSNNISVTGAYRTANGMRNFQLIQAPGMMLPGGGNVQLTISDMDNLNQDMQPRSISAPDFKTLINDNPRETSEYMRPIFEAMHQYNILKYDLAVMSQVFLAELNPDDTIRTQLNSLLPKLDAEEYKDRKQASADIAAMGTKGAVVLAKLDRTKLSPEQDARVSELLAPYHVLNDAEMGRLRSDPRFLLQCMDCDEPELRGLGFKHLVASTGKKIDYDPQAAPDQRHKTVSLLEADLFKPTTQPATQPAPQQTGQSDDGTQIFINSGNVQVQMRVGPAGK